MQMRTLSLCFPVLVLAFSANAQQVFKSESGDVRVDTVASGLSNPWGLAFLPDGRMLVTERPGRMRIVARDGTLSAPLAGVPAVYAANQGGLLDVVLDRDFAKNATIYFCYSDPVSGGSQTALARARLDAGATPQLLDVKRIFRQEGPPSSGLHYGCRIAQARDGNLFLTTGEHYSYRDFAQLLDVPVPLEHQPTAAKRIRDKTIRARFCVTPLNREHAIRMRKIPGFATVAVREAREHELRTHRAIADKPAMPQSFEQGFFHFDAGDFEPRNSRNTRK